MSDSIISGEVVFEGEPQHLDYFSHDDERHRIFVKDLSAKLAHSADWFDIPNVRSEADKLHIQSQTVNYKTIRTAGGEGGNRSQRRQRQAVEIAEVDLRKEYIYLLRKTIKEWSFIDFRTGRVMPIDEHSLLKLGPIGAMMGKAIEEYYESVDWTEDEEKNSGNPALLTSGAVEDYQMTPIDIPNLSGSKWRDGSDMEESILSNGSQHEND